MFGRPDRNSFCEAEIIWISLPSESEASAKLGDEQTEAILVLIPRFRVQASDMAQLLRAFATKTDDWLALRTIWKEN